MKLEFKECAPFCLPKKELVRSLEDAGENDLKVLLMLRALSDDGLFDTDECKDEVLGAVGITDAEFESAVAYWRGARVIRLQKNRSGDRKSEKKTLLESKLPDYTEDEMAQKIDTASDLKETIDECQQIIGKIFTPADTSVIVGMSDRLGLSGEYITVLVAYCVGMGKKSLRYIEKTACELYDTGIDTEKKLAEYIKKKESLHEAIPTIKRMIGAGERELTSKEKALVEKWIGEYAYDVEVVRLAYERAVTKVENGKFIPYMGGILDRWYKQGLRTCDEINAMIASYKQSKENAVGSFDTDDAFEKALKKTMRELAGDSNS